MVKLYYGNSYKEALGNDPIFVDESKIKGYEDNYNYVDYDDISYDDIQDEMSDKDRIRFYESETGIHLDEVNDEFWDWAEENYGYYHIFRVEKYL